MTTEISIDRSDRSAIVRLIGAIRSKGKALRRIGALGTSEAQAAFAGQSFGEFRWAERYPNQSEPFVNVAGAIADFSSGLKEPKQRRFDRRPAVRDTGNLMGSIAHEVVSDEAVRWGSVVPYAAIHQFGLVSTQPVDEPTKNRIAAWLLTDSGREYRPRMLPVLKSGVRQWDTDVVQRPFLGVTPGMEEDIRSIVESAIAEEAGDGGA